MAKLVLGTNKNTYVIPASVRNVTPEYYVEFVVDNNGKIDTSKTTKFMDFSGVKEILQYRLAYAYYNSTYSNINYHLDFSELRTVGTYGVYYAFYGCNGIIGTLNFDELTSIASYGMSNAFENCTNITSVTFSKNISLSNYSLAYAFRNCTSLVSIDLSKQKNATNNDALYYICSGCTNLQTANLSNLESVGFDSLSYAFQNCTSLTSLDLSSVLVNSGNYYPMRYICSGCTSLTNVNLSSLANINSQNFLSNGFQNCTSLSTLSFPGLHSQSFGSYTNQFNQMLKGCSNVTVHFPSNVQSIIGSWSDVTNGFGGTNTTVLFDLPPTIRIKGANNYTCIRQHKKDTLTALAWYYNSSTTVYTSGTSTPSVGDTIYSDPECTTILTTVSTIVS